MKLAGSRLLLIAAAVGMITAVSSPAFAWTCTAKAEHGKSYSAFGFTPKSACWHAMYKCKAAKGDECKVVKK